MIKAKEDWICVPKNTIEVLQKNEFRFKKQLGQNFLIDMHVMEKILRAADVGPKDVCLEIGPGIGSLTQALLENAGRVVAVEIDDRLIPILEENLADYPNLTLVHADFMDLDLPAFFVEQGIDRPVKVAANLPYYITTPIIMELFESGVPLESVTVMVQEEVARRMKAGPGTKDYGALSLAVQYYAEPYIAAFVPQNCFMPRPNVGSCVIRLTRREETPVEVISEKEMFNIIRAAFSQRRKTLVNSVSNAEGLTYTKEQVLAAVQEAGLSETVRGEALSLEEFARLTNILMKEVQS